MAEVGVLELSIRDNSTEAASGLGKLEKKLIGVKSAAENFNLSPVTTQIAGIVNAVKDNTKTVSALGTLFNAIEKFSKLKTPKIDVQPLEDIKETLGKGWNLGQAGTQLNKIREALEKDWKTDNAENVNTALKSIADGVNSVSATSIKSVATNIGLLADKMEKFADSASKVSSSSGAHDIFMQAWPAVSSDAVAETKKNVQQIIDTEENYRRYREGYERGLKKWEESGRHGIPLDLQFFGGKRGSKKSAGQMEMDIEGLRNVQSQVQYATEAVTEYKEKVDQTIEQSSAANEIKTPFDSLSSSIKNATDDLAKFSGLYKEFFNTSYAAYSGPVANSMMLSTQVGSSSQYEWKPNWTNYDPDFAQQQIQAAAEAISNLTNEINAIPNTKTEEALSTKPVEQFNIVLQETGDILTSVVVPRFQEMYRMLGEMSDRFGWFKENKITVPKLEAGPDLHRPVDEDKMLSTYVENFKPDWVVYEKWMPDWTMVEDKISKAADQAKRGKEETGDWLQRAIELHKQQQEKYRSVPETFETWYNGISGSGRFKENDLMAQWLRGNGTANEIKYALEETARHFNMTVDEVKQKCAELQEQYAKAAEGAREFVESVKESYSIIQMASMRWDGAEAFNQLFQMANAARMGQTLGSGSPAGYLGEAIPGEGYVSDEQSTEMIVMSQVTDDYANSLNGLNQETNEAIALHTRFMNAVSNLYNSINGSFSDISSGIRTFKNGLKSAFPTLSGLLSRFKQIAKYRFLRAVLRQITSGVSEGIKNVYNYSQAIGGSFSESMDSAASSLLKMKNSIGAALAPAIQALIPYIQMAVNWFITLLNYINQFFALLNGQKSWTRAVDTTTKAYKDQTKAAKGASAAVKDLLADWDELNIIQSNSGGGGGGGGKSDAEDYLEMFEEVDKFSSKVKDVVDFIKNNFETIKTLAEAIGLAILAWKISSAFGNTLSGLQKLSLIAGLTLVISGIKMVASAGYSIGRDGINGEDAVKAVGGVVATMLGGGLTGLAFAGTAGGIIGLAIGGALSIGILDFNIQQGRLDSLYGSLHKDVDDIRDELEENLLTTDAKLHIQVLEAVLKNQEEAEGKVQTAIDDLNKSYPVGVTVDAGNAEDFKGKIEALVTATNELIETNKDTMKKIYVPATAEFTSTFIDDAWGSIEGTVGYLGEKIGEELSKSIIDNTRIDDLKEKLLKLSGVILNAQMSSEFAGSIGAMGADVRENTRLGKFDREANAAYMAQYNELGKEYMGKATAQATLEYQKAMETVAGLKESIGIYENEIASGTLSEEEMKNIQKEVKKMKDELFIAQKELDAWDNGVRVASRARELYDEWTLGGKVQYGSDISASLRMAMEKNKNYGGQRDLAMNMASYDLEHNATTDWVDKYIASLKAYLNGAIAHESGMDENAVKEFLGLSGIDAIDLFDDDFVDKYKNQLLDMFYRNGSKITKDQQLKIWEAMGFSTDEFNSAMAEFNKQTKPPKLNNIIDIGKNQILYWDRIVKMLNEANRDSENDIEPIEIPAEVEEINPGNFWENIINLGKNNIIFWDDFWGNFLNGPKPEDTLSDIIGQYDFSKYAEGDLKRTINGLSQSLVEQGYDPETVRNTIMESLRKVFDEETVNKLMNGSNGIPIGVDPVVDSTEFHNTVQEQINDMDPVEVPAVIKETIEDNTGGLDDVFGQVQDIIFGSGSLKKNNYNEMIADMYRNGNLTDLKQLLEDIKSMGIDEAFTQMNKKVYGSDANPSALPALQNQGNVGYQTAAGVQDSEPDYSQMEAGTRRATSDANAPIVSELSTIAARLLQILNKPSTTIVQPSSALGIVNRAAAVAFDKVTGG